MSECSKPTVQAGTDGFCTLPVGHEGPCVEATPDPIADPEQVKRLWFWRTSDVGPVEWVRSTYDPGPSSRPDYECIEVVPASALEASEREKAMWWKAALDSTEALEAAEEQERKLQDKLDDAFERLADDPSVVDSLRARLEAAEDAARDSAIASEDFKLAKGDGAREDCR